MLSRQLVTSSVRQSARVASVKSFSSIEAERIEVEHGRGKWKTYGDISSYTPGKYQVKTFNKISPIGLARFPAEKYVIRTDKEEARNAHAIMLRSHKLQEDQVPHTVRAIAR